MKAVFVHMYYLSFLISSERLSFSDWLVNDAQLFNGNRYNR